MSDTAPRVGLFGGSFDPVHRAHLALARTALEALRLDAVRWLPAGQPWQKTALRTPGDHRAAMVALAIEGEPRFVLDRRELDRTGPSYTIDTVRELQAEAPGTRWVLLIGQDQHAGLPTWREWPALLEAVELAVAARPGAPARPLPPELAGRPFTPVPMPAMDVSATAIRQRLAAGGDITEWVPPQVARYIAQHRLYQAGS